MPLTLLTLDAWDFVKIKHRPCSGLALMALTDLFPAGVLSYGTP